MNAKSSTKSFLYRKAAIFMIAMMLFAGMASNPVYATTVTYNFQTNTGTTVATGVVTNDAVCGTNQTVATITLMSMAPFGCMAQVVRPTTSGAQNILDVWFNTAYTSDTTVTGSSLKIRLREASGSVGTATPWTAGIMLMYVNASGTITNFTGTEVTQVVNDGSNADYTLSLADQSATVPAGSKLGVRIRATAGTSTSMRVYYGSAASTGGGTSGVLIVDEKQTTTLNVAAATGTYGGTTDLSATLTNSAGSPISGKTISFTLNGSSVGSATTNASGVASLSSISLTGINAGNYPTGLAAIFAGDTNYVTSNSTNGLDVAKATPTLSVTNSPVPYNGSPQPATVAGSVAGVASNIQYNGSATVPTDAGTYAITADFVPTDTTNYTSLTDASAGDFVIDKAAPTLSVTNSPVTYNGSPQAATIVGSVAGVVSNIQYDGSSTAPTDVGTYTVTADFMPTDTTNYTSLTDAPAGDFTIDKAIPTLSVTNLPVTYNGVPQAATVAGSVAGVASNIQYNGSATVPTDAGTYAVTADFVPTNTANYNSLTNASAGNFVIDKATPTLSLTNSPVTYNGSPQAATVVSSIDGVVSGIQYDGSATVPTNAGTYAVTANIVPTDTTNYTSLTDASAGNFVIDKATPTLSLTNSPVPYNGSPQAATVTGSVAGVASNLEYDGSATVPTNAGTYAVTANFVPTDTTNYTSLTDASAGDFVIDKGTPTLSVTNSPVMYTGSPQAATVEGSIDGVVSNIRYDGSSTMPTDIGTYAVTADFVPTDTTNYTSLTDASAGDFVIIATDHAEVDVKIAGNTVGNYAVPFGERISDEYGINGGPVHVESTNAQPIFTSQRAIFASSFNSIIGYPGDQLTTDYWFTTYDDVGMITFLVIGNPDEVQTAEVDVFIGDNKMNATPYQIAPGQRIFPRYGINGGPVHVVSTNGVNIFTSERTKFEQSFNEVMGYPGHQLTTEYWFTSYDDVGMITFLVIGNPHTSQTAEVDVYIGGNKMNATPYQIAPGQRIFPRYGINGGPVRVVSTNGVNIFTSERTKFKDSFNEVMGYPADQVHTEFWFTSYDDTSMITYLIIGNPSSSQTAEVDVYIGGVKQNATPIQIAPGQRFFDRYGANSGLVRVVSTNGVNVFASERSKYLNSFNEILGIAGNQLTTDYWFTSYDDVGMDTKLVIGAP